MLHGGNFDAVAAGAFGVVERFVGAAEQVFGSLR